MVGEFKEEMKKSNKKIIENFGFDLKEAIKEHRLTYSGWLRFVKKLSQEEISSLIYDTEKNNKIIKEYEDWFKWNN